MVWEYWFILLGITEYIIYRSFIKSLKYTGEYDTDNSTQAGIRHNIRWLIAIDTKQLLKSIIIMAAISVSLYRLILYDDYILCAVLAVILIILNISDIPLLYKNISAVLIYVNMLINISVVIKVIWSIKRNSIVYTEETASIYIIPFIIFVSIIMLFAFIRYNNYRKVSIGRITYIAVIMTVVAQNIILMMVYKLMPQQINDRYVVYVILMFVICIAKDIVCISMIEIDTGARHSYEEDILKIQIDTNNRLYGNIKEAQEELKDIRHDLKNRLNTLSYAIQLRDYDEAEKELDNILDNINTAGQPKYCTNLRVNSILSYKLSEVPEGVNITYDVKVPEELDVDYSDLGVIIGNLIDNSKHAVSRVLENNMDAYIDIKLICHADNIVFIIKNNYINTPEARTIDYYKNHGRGIGSVRKIIKKYDGMYDVKKTEYEYVTSVSVGVRNMRM